MCIVIDTNVLPSVFKVDSTNHAQFKPVKDWIIKGKGKVVFGGSKYLAEIKEKYLVLFSELKKAGKAIYIPNDIVDKQEEIVNAMIVHPDFDDPHLVALLRVSKCKLICSLDKRAFPYFRHSQFFRLAADRPRIYSSITNASLLCDRHIADICKPCIQLTKQQRVAFEQ